MLADVVEERGPPRVVGEPRRRHRQLRREEMGRLEAAGRTLHEHEAAHEQARPHQKDEGQRVLEHDEDRVRPSRPSAQAGPPAVAKRVAEGEAGRQQRRQRAEA